MKVSPFAGKSPEPGTLVNVPRLITAYYTEVPDALIPSQRVAFGTSGHHYWGRIAERYRLDLTVVNEAVDPTFRFMTVDWDGQIRMDPSSSFAMTNLVGLRILEEAQTIVTDAVAKADSSKSALDEEHL